MKTLLSTAILGLLLSGQAFSFIADCQINSQGGPRGDDSEFKEPELYHGFVTRQEVFCFSKQANYYYGEVRSYGAGLLVNGTGFSISCPMQSEKSIIRRLKKKKNVRFYTGEAQVGVFLGLKAGAGVGRFGNPCVVLGIENSIGVEAGLHVMKLDRYQPLKD